MSEKYITAAECLTALKDIGLNVTKGAFSKQKEKGIYKVYKMPNTKRELFIWDEVLTGYLGSTIPKDHTEEKLRAEIKKKHKIQKLINEQWNIMNSHENITFEMFDIKDLGISAAESLKELKKKDTKGETTNDQTRAFILSEAAKTKEDHIEDFKRGLFEENTGTEHIHCFIMALFENLQDEYPISGSKLQLDILKYVNDYRMTPQEYADSDGVDLIKL